MIGQWGEYSVNSFGLWLVHWVVSVNDEESWNYGGGTDNMPRFSGAAMKREAALKQLTLKRSKQPNLNLLRAQP